MCKLKMEASYLKLKGTELNQIKNGLLQLLSFFFFSTLHVFYSQYLEHLHFFRGEKCNSLNFIVRFCIVMACRIEHYLI